MQSEPEYTNSGKAINSDVTSRDLADSMPSGNSIIA